jgi:glycosyltransferase involved in cell wall biosynthesis
MTIWFDIDDLIHFFRNNQRPTGIQRLSFETCRAVWRQAGASGNVGFCRHRDGASLEFTSVHFPALEAGILATINATEPPAPTPGASSRIMTRARRHIPPQYRRPLGAAARATLRSMRALQGFVRAGMSSGPRGAAPGAVADAQSPDVIFRPGDWLVNLGAFWDARYEPAFLDDLSAKGVRLAILVHDIIPELFPELCAQPFAGVFSTLLRDIVPKADLIFANSHRTGDDLAACMRRLEKRIPTPVVLPVGGKKHENIPAAAPILDRPYVLIVGTIEARKNHHAMMRVWRRLLRTMPEAAVPDLVFAGKVGWLAGDLCQQLQNAKWFGGKVQLIEFPSDADLASLYQHCLFSVFASLYEGFGLPVMESLCFGKTVAASNSSSIPEVGGEFCVYFDPDNINDAYRVIRGLIEKPERVAELEARIAARFKPPSWEDTAAAILTQLRSRDLLQGGKNARLVLTGMA